MTLRINKPACWWLVEFLTICCFSLFLGWRLWVVTQNKIPGPRGERGEQGEIGHEGIKGETGPRGLPGETIIPKKPLTRAEIEAIVDERLKQCWDATPKKK